MYKSFREIATNIHSLEQEVQELKKLQSKLPKNRSFYANMELAYSKQINQILHQKLALEALPVTGSPEELEEYTFLADQVTSSQIAESKTISIEKDIPLSDRAQKIHKFLWEMPKVEIHLHMEACISQSTLKKLLEKNKIDYNPADLSKLYNFKNLQEFIQLFLFILDSIRNPDDFELIFQNLRDYLESNNIRYAEVFLAPSRLIANGLDFHEITKHLDFLAAASIREGGPEVKFLIDVSRTFGAQNAAQNVDRVLQSKSNHIIGIGLGGAELLGAARDFVDVYNYARSEGLRCVAHAGEDDGPWSVRDTLLLLQAERIGHATSAIQDPELIDLLKERRTPLEICLTSNIFTGKYVNDPRKHPVRHYYDEGLVCTVNTDDPEIFNINLSEEYFKYYHYLDFTLDEMIDLNQQGVYSTFHPNPKGLWSTFSKEIEALSTKYNL